MGEVTRVGQTVRRISGPWTTQVQALMQSLRDEGLEFVPVPQGVDEQGREVVKYIDGDVGVYPMPQWVWSDHLLCEVALAVRRLHDASRRLPRPSTGWRRSPVEPSETICHSDVAPYNVVCRDGHLVAIIDWDFAVPAPAEWDLGYLAYRWISLTGPDHPDGLHSSVDEQRRRLDLLCTADGGVTPHEVLLWAERRLDDLIDYSIARAQQADPTFVTRTELGHVDLYRRDLAWLRSTYLRTT
jgi:hypothetical protein